MKLAIVTNLANHYTLGFAEELYCQLGDGFSLICTTPIPEDRRELGWRESSYDRDYVIRTWESELLKKHADNWINSADVVVRGDSPLEPFSKRILDGKLTFRYQERIFKEDLSRFRLWASLRLKHLPKWRKLDRSNHHLLAAGAYCSYDMKRLGLFRNRMWRFGYFLPSTTDDIPPRPSGPVRILNAGRLLWWKRGPLLIEAARYLCEQGYDNFRLDIIGAGEEEPIIRKLITDYNLQKWVKLLPPVPPATVHEQMRLSHIYVLPSNYSEGWGVVINEAMDAGCCVVASDGAGATPWLVRHGYTGFRFPAENLEPLVAHLAKLIDSPDLCRVLGCQARMYLRENWSAKVAAERLISLSEALLGHGQVPDYEDGPCSPDPALGPNEYPMNS